MSGEFRADINPHLIRQAGYNITHVENLRGNIKWNDTYIALKRNFLLSPTDFRPTSPLQAFQKSWKN